MANTVTILYKDYDTEELIAPSDIYEVKQIAGYDIFIPTGTNGDQTIVYHFKEIKGSITISYIDIDTGNKILDDEVIADQKLGLYVYTSKIINGYEVFGNLNQQVELTEQNRNQVIVFTYQKAFYLVELDKFGIKNDGTMPVETSKGINNALIYARNNNYKKVVFPIGQYCISELNPIIMLSDMIVDLNGAVFKINTNGMLKYDIINFTGCKNSKLINGTLLGDRYSHDYTTIKGTHEWCCAVAFNDCEDCMIEHVTVKSVPGYGVTSSLGKNISNLIIGVTLSNLQIGNIGENGVLNNVSGTIRTINPIDISKVGGEFELGYNKGYMGYPYMQARLFDAYFYKNNKQFLSAIKGCKQYHKVAIPPGAEFVQFVFHQSILPTKGDTDFNSTTVFLTNYVSPNRITIRNCIIDDNRSLGMGLCGGRNFLIEGNTLSNNKGNAPGYAIDMEDGWEYMVGYLFKNNVFINNANDVVICAGDNIRFEDNSFTSTVYMYGRTTNYSFVNNEFTNILLNINYEYSTDTIIDGNKYTDCKVSVVSKSADAKADITNETYVNTSISIPSTMELLDSVILSDSTYSVRLTGSFRRCKISCAKGDYVSAALNDCSIENTVLNSQGSSVFNHCNFKNSTTLSTSNTVSIIANQCTFIDSLFYLSTWAAITKLEIQNSDIQMLTSDKSFVYLSAGKTGDLLFRNNKVNSMVDKPVFNLYDTTYTVPKGNAIIESNAFTLTKYLYVVDGVNITSGIFNFTNRSNTITGAAMLAPRYLNNQYFVILI